MQPMTHNYTPRLHRLQRDSHDQCSVCSLPFKEGDTAHSGYDSNRQELYVGACCQNLLAETARRTRWQQLAYTVPDKESILWRYMDFAKFVSILRSKSLYFSRTDLLGDRFEGAKGITLNKSTWETHYLDFFRQAIRNPPPDYSFKLSDEQVERNAKELLDSLNISSLSIIKSTFVSCWYENEGESEAIWRLYCPPPSIGIAIRTTYSALNKSLGDDLSISIGQVKYIDFKKEFADINDAIFRKRQSLSHEKEVRAVIRESGINEILGKALPVDLSTLLHEVVISPFAPTWFKDVLQETMLRYDVTAKVSFSELLLDPFF